MIPIMRADPKVETDRRGLQGARAHPAPRQRVPGLRLRQPRQGYIHVIMIIIKTIIIIMMIIIVLDCITFKVF